MQQYLTNDAPALFGQRQYRRLGISPMTAKYTVTRESATEGNREVR